MISSLADLADTLAGQHGPAVVLATFLFMAAETSLLVGLLVPGDAAVLLFGTTVGTPWQYAALIAAAALGAMMGETIGYLIGSRYGTAVRYSRLGRRLGEGRWARAEEVARGESGGRALIATRFVPVLHSMVPVIAGTLGMPYRRFIAWEAAGCLVWAATYLGIGALAGTALRAHGSQMGYAASAVLVALILTVTAVSRKVRRR
ncbi:VTT domain-containing protein [Microbispora sp. RL4-1S]|uniref:VTT domain-containing protein n=1 Tax=Microbispora oryzae TaxID=2806554 RepID=A0A941AGC1_9ACTN|nr:VTT domain-containing protein [Microbispora oryzae]MBP2702760.1 VTT domain-containing protein [Microbispora oryzae]